MKTKLLTTFLFMIAAVFYSCSKESDSTDMQNNDAGITTAQKQIIISNCSSHSGCHAGARVTTAGTMSEINTALLSAIKPHHNLGICDRSKLQVWVNGEGN